MELVDRLVSPRQLLRAKITTLSSSCHTVMLLAGLVLISGCSGGGDSSAPAPAPAAQTFETLCTQNNIARFRLFNDKQSAVIRLLINGSVVTQGGQELRAAPGGFSELHEVAAGVPFVVTAQRLDNNAVLPAVNIPAQPKCTTFSVTY